MSSTEFKLLISAVDTFCITFTAAKFLDSLGKCCGGVIFRGSLRHLAGFRTDFLSALCLTVSKPLASFWAVKLTLQIPRLKKKGRKNPFLRLVLVFFGFSHLYSVSVHHIKILNCSVSPEHRQTSACLNDSLDFGCLRSCILLYYWKIYSRDETRPCCTTSNFQLCL